MRDAKFVKYLNVVFDIANLQPKKIKTKYFARFFIKMQKIFFARFAEFGKIAQIVITIITNITIYIRLGLGFSIRFLYGFMKVYLTKKSNFFLVDRNIFFTFAVG